MNPDSYIFADIDGVFNSHKWLFDERAKAERDGVKDWNKELRLRYELDPAAVARLATILDRCIAAGFNTKIVISSSWRIHTTVGEFRRAFMFRGLSKEHAVRIISRTPSLNIGGNTTRRGLEIQAWLDERWGTPPDGGAAIPKPPRLCILDDDSDMAHLMPHLVKTTYQHGLLDEHIGPCVKLLTLTTHSNLP